MLRNLNQSTSGKRILGTPRSGVLGSMIPSTGDAGPGYCYNDLSLPADASKDIRGYITVFPTAGVFAANEDTSFTFSGAPDGSYFANYQLFVDGVSVGSPATIYLTVGAGGTTIAATVGNSIAAGSSAIINSQLVISCLTGNSVVQGSNATVQRVISSVVGNASAEGQNAVIQAAMAINASVANCVSDGRTAQIIFNAGAIKAGDRLTFMWLDTSYKVELL